MSKYLSIQFVASTAASLVTGRSLVAGQSKAMCGRYVVKSRVSQLGTMFDLIDVPTLSPRYNVAPTQMVPAVRLKTGTKRTGTGNAHTAKTVGMGPPDKTLGAGMSTSTSRVAGCSKQVHHRTFTIRLAKRELFRVSVIVTVWFPLLTRIRPLKVCTPLSAAVKV